jgi:hypothetical protein
VKIVENQIGTDINLVDDLGFDKDKGFSEGRLQIKVRQYHKFNFAYLPLKWDGDKVITQNIQFSGQTYSAGTRVQSEMDLKMLKGGYEYEFFGGWLGFFAATVDVLVADASIRLNAPGTQGSIRRNIARFPFP